VRPGGTVWVGTAGGLARITASGLVRVGEPALTRPVFALTSDPHGRLWLGTDAGVFRWDGQELAHLDVADGLLGSETNRAALVTGRQGRVWIGTSGGVSVYDDVWERAPRVPPQTWIDGVTADGEALGPDTGRVLPAGTTELVYRFGAAAFRDEHRVRFRTFLEGFDPGWRPAERLPGRRIRYTALPAGKYRLHVQAIGPHGTPGSIAVAAPVRIEPPLWQRPWFRILLAAAGIGLVWLVAAALHDHRYARRLSAEIADRTAALAASEREQRLASARLTAVLESTSDGVVAVDGRGHILLANPAAGAMLGRPAGALPGRSLTDVLPELRPVAGVLAQGEDAPAAERSGAITLPGRPPARPGRELEYVVTPWRPEGREGDVGAAPGGGVIALRDVTERRRAEAERARAQRLESLGVLAGGIAHDFNNLLTAILGHASLIEETPDVPDPERRSAASIRRAGERAQALTVKLLTFARGGAPQTEPCDLGELLRETAELALSGTSVSARLALAPDLHPVEVDRAQMTQVISNLLINARQAMPDGGVVEIEAGNATLLPDADVADPAEPADVAGETTAPVPGVQVAIRDHGPGIAPDQQQRIFEPYFSTKSDGTGLGLAVCHSVVARHGGWLGVRSTPGEGATFLIELPAAARPTTARPAPEAPAADPQPPAPAPDPAPSRTGGRILVLDDEPPVRSLLEQVLTAAGHEVVAVATGEQAIQAYTAAHGHPGRAFAAVIMDLTIPGDLGGAEALARIRAVDPGVRAIVASGYSQDPVMSAYRAHGFVARLAKPFDRSTLLEVVGRVLAARDDGAS
jgi:PAS domain S-box-containing protein